MKQLPIGRQSFVEIRKNDLLYIDKTKYIYNLITKGSVYFLSRPRRFGKSLLISTLNEIFSGNKELFKELYIYETNYEWKEYPVIRVDFSAMKPETPEALKKGIIYFLNSTAEKYNVELTNDLYELRFAELISKLKQKGQVVILIDEYDKPIIDYLTKPELAKEMREILKGFYTIIKANDENIRFVLLTGVSKFSKAGVFSGLNNLNDISMNRDYSAMLGITQEELINNFSEYIEEFCKTEKYKKEELISKIKNWYNGYCFSIVCEKVYNPFSTLLLFSEKEFRNYWFETGTPNFLIELMKSVNFDVGQIPLKAEAELFNTYELERLLPIPLLFQTGYLTIKDYNKERMLYTLDYPNFEVKNSFINYISKKYINSSLSESVLYDLIDSLREKNFENFFQILRSIFASIEYDLHLSNEKYYQTVFYIIFTMIGLKVSAEVKTNIGRIDVVIDDTITCIFEFKYIDSSSVGTHGRASIDQIKTKKYYEKYLNNGKEIYLIGAEFKDKNIEEWIVEKLSEIIISKNI